MKRGEVWWANLPDPAGRRPVVLLTRSGAYSYLSKVTTAALTTTIRPAPTHVLVGEEDGLSRTCVINLDDIHGVSKGRLTERICELSSGRMREVDEALRFALGLD